MQNPYDVEPSPQRLPNQRVRSPGSLYRSTSNTSVHSTKVKLQQLQPIHNAIQPQRNQPVIEKINYTNLFHRFHSPALSSRSSSPKSPVSLHEFNMLRQQALDRQDKTLQRIRKHNHDKIMTKQLFLSQSKQRTPSKQNSKRQLLVSRLLMNSSAIVFEATKQTIRPQSRQSSRKQSPSKTVNMEAMLTHQINQAFDHPTFMTSPAIKLDVSKLLLQTGMLPREQKPVMMQNHSFVRDNMLELTLAIYGIEKVSNGIRVKLGKLPDDRVQAFALLLSRRMGFALSSKQKQTVRLFFKEFRVQDKKQVYKILMPSSPQSTKQSSVANLLLPSSSSSKMLHNYVSQSSVTQMKRIIVDDSDSCSDPEEYEIYEGFVNKKFTTESPLLVE